MTCGSWPVSHSTSFMASSRLRRARTILHRRADLLQDVLRPPASLVAARRGTGADLATDQGYYLPHYSVWCRERKPFGAQASARGHSARPLLRPKDFATLRTRKVPGVLLVSPQTRMSTM